MKIRGTAQHVAEKYLQLARDAQSSGDTIMAESLLQHAEHYFRLIAAAQAPQVNGFGRSQTETEADMAEDDDDFAALPDRFAPLSERLPPAAYQPAPQPYAPQPQPQPQFAQPQPQPQPFEERPVGEMRVEPRAERMERQPRPDRPPFRERNVEGGERGRHQGYDRNRDGRRFTPRSDAGDADASNGLPSFITAPPARVSGGESDAEGGFTPERSGGRDHEGVNFHLSSRRRRRPRPPMDENGPDRTDAAPNELPVEPDRY